KLEMELRELQASVERFTPTEKAKITKKQADLKKLADRDRLRGLPAPLNFEQKIKPGDPERGRFLFTVKSCLGCHSHQALETPKGKPADWGSYFPAVHSEAMFGPNLSQVAAKLGKSDKDSARIWLRQWIMDPHVHSPRSRMPVTHMDAREAADIAEWLLSEK